jgi:hypothetical protein
VDQAEAGTLPRRGAGRDWSAVKGRDESHPVRPLRPGAMVGLRRLCTSIPTYCLPPYSSTGGLPRCGLSRQPKRYAWVTVTASGSPAPYLLSSSCRAPDSLISGAVQCLLAGSRWLLVPWGGRSTGRMIMAAPGIVSKEVRVGPLQFDRTVWLFNSPGGSGRGPEAASLTLVLGPLAVRRHDDDGLPPGFVFPSGSGPLNLSRPSGRRRAGSCGQTERLWELAPVDAPSERVGYVPNLSNHSRASKSNVDA